MAQDRIDMQFAAKEISRFMSKPEKEDWLRAKRMARYLKGSERVVVKFDFQNMPEEVVVWSDTDFAGCRRTRRSTSGGVVTLDSHCVKTYSLTQDAIALSSGESEFYGIVKAAAQGLGIKGLMTDMGLSMELRVNTDSSAAKSIASRRGCGKVRHLETRELWLQDRVARGDLEIRKVRGEDNIADILTKHVGKDLLDKRMVTAGYERRTGRHWLSPTLG